MIGQKKRYQSRGESINSRSQSDAVTPPSGAERPPAILPPREDRRPFFWPLLLAGLTLATLLPIGIHTVMLDDLGIPYPAAFPHAGWAIVPDQALLVFGEIWLDTTLRNHRVFGMAGRLLFVFVTVAAINQALFRLPVMLNAVSTKWTIYPFIDHLPEVLKFAAIVILVVAASPFAKSVTAKAAIAVLVSIALDSLITPLLQHLFEGVVAADAALEGDQLYTVPYDWHVDLPSYLTYIEPASAAIVIALALRRCGVPARLVALIIFALLGGPLFKLALNIVYVPRHPIMAMLSVSQFTVESAALAALAAGISSVLVRKPPGRGMRG